MLKGIDISQWQGKRSPEDFCAAWDLSGVRFCYLKATEGAGFTDPTFMHNAGALATFNGNANPIYPGAYHFARPDSNVGSAAKAREDAIREAHDFIRTIEASRMNERPMLPPALDLEKYGENGPAETREWVQAFSYAIEAAFDVRPVIYTGKNWWRYEAGNSEAFTDHPLWVVSYTRNAADWGDRLVTLSVEKPPGDMPWDRWTFWQWSGGGKFAHHGPIAGFGQGAVDVNWFNGDESDLRALLVKPEEARDAAQADPNVAKLRTMRDFHREEMERISSVLKVLGEE